MGEWKRLLCGLMAVALLACALPAAHAAGGTVEIGNTVLAEGENSIGGGTATLNTAAGTLALKNVVVSSGLFIRWASAFTITASGMNSIAPAQGVNAIYADAPALAIRLQQDASLTLAAQSGANAVYCPSGSLTAAGPGSLNASSLEYPALQAQGDVVLEAGLKAGLGSDSQAICSLAGGVTVDSASLAAHSKDAAVYAGGASTGGIYPGTSVVLRGSTVTLDVTQGYDAVWAAQGGIVVEDSVVEIQGRKDANGGLALYSDGDIAIRGAGTQLTAASTYGISAVQNMTVEAGTLDVSAYDGDAFQAAAMQISGGQVQAYSATGRALCTTDGTLSITGAGTRVTAVSENAKRPTIYSYGTGGIFLDAGVSAENTAGGRPFEGVDKTEGVSDAITLGANCEAVGVKVHTVPEAPATTTPGVRSWFVPADGGQAPGKVTVCRHVWGAPVWAWAGDYSAAAATFACGNDAAHTRTVQATVTSETRGGSTVYTAVATFEGKAYTDVKTMAGQQGGGTGGTAPAQKPPPKTGI